MDESLGVRPALADVRRLSLGPAARELTAFRNDPDVERFTDQMAFRFVRMQREETSFVQFRLRDAAAIRAQKPPTSGKGWTIGSVGEEQERSSSYQLRRDGHDHERARLRKELNALAVNLGAHMRATFPHLSTLWAGPLPKKPIKKIESDGIQLISPIDKMNETLGYVALMVTHGGLDPFGGLRVERSRRSESFRIGKLPEGPFNTEDEEFLHVALVEFLPMVVSREVHGPLMYEELYTLRELTEQITALEQLGGQPFNR